jgi:hypothetical protein
MLFEDLLRDRMFDKLPVSLQQNMLQYTKYDFDIPYYDCLNNRQKTENTLMNIF